MLNTILIAVIITFSIAALLFGSLRKDRVTRLMFVISLIGIIIPTCLLYIFGPVDLFAGIVDEIGVISIGVVLSLFLLLNYDDADDYYN